MSSYTVQSPWHTMSTTAQPTFNRDQAMNILHDHVKNENLRRHMFATESAMRMYANKYGGDPDQWGLVGLLHDFDWEIHPTLEDHPTKGQPILESRGVPKVIRDAILAHAPHTGIKPSSMMEKCIFAVDEISGFIVACALVKPNKTLAEVTVDDIVKKLKSKGFAAKVSREEIQQGVDLLGLPAAEHFQNVLTAMQSIHQELGL